MVALSFSLSQKQNNKNTKELVDWSVVGVAYIRLAHVLLELMTSVSLNCRVNDVPETDVPDGCPRDGGSRRMSLRRRIQTDVPETEDPDGCPREGGSRRMSPRRRIQADVPETEDPDGCP